MLKKHRQCAIHQAADQNQGERNTGLEQHAIPRRVLLHCRSQRDNLAGEVGERGGCSPRGSKCAGRIWSGGAFQGLLTAYGGTRTCLRWQSGPCLRPLYPTEEVPRESQKGQTLRSHNLPQPCLPPMEKKASPRSCNMAS